jgi:hypothetical protein
VSFALLERGWVVEVVLGQRKLVRGAESAVDRRD